ncbi:MAG: hypothetical protein AB1894_05020 [Chloroflexota bacterium]
MFGMWLRQVLLMSTTTLLLFLAYCLAAMWQPLARLLQKIRRATS